MSSLTQAIAPAAGRLLGPLASRVEYATGGAAREQPKALPLGLRAVDEALPEGGLPRGAVVEIASPIGLARATSLALAACASAQAEARLRGGEQTAGAWCAWVEVAAGSTPKAPSLFAPAVVRAGVDLGRLLVVHPPPEALARVAVRVATSRVFSVVVIDAAGIPGARSRERLDRWVTVVRRLALAVEGTDTAIVLLTDLLARRSMPLPVAMRIELERPSLERLELRVAKDRRGRIAPPRAISVADLKRDPVRPTAEAARERPRLVIAGARQATP